MVTFGVPSAAHVASALGTAPSRQSRIPSSVSMSAIQSSTRSRPRRLKECDFGNEFKSNHIVSIERKQRTHKRFRKSKRLDFGDECIDVALDHIHVPLVEGPHFDLL